MKRIFLICCVFAATLGRAQEITEPGWFNAVGTFAPAPVLKPLSSRSVSSAPLLAPLALSGAPSIAETDSPEIQALARGLENDPVRIYNYVHDHIRHVLYFGSKKGAQLTLLERSGNDFDQCALLVALLRAAGHSPSYEFGFLQMDYDSPDHYDLKHWLQLSLSNTNPNNTANYLSILLTARGYPTNAFLFPGTNTFAFQRVWVKLPIGATNYYLDPAFKVSEPLSRIDVPSAMGFNSNSLWTAAGGGGTADFVTNLNEVAVRNNLRDYTTNLLGWLQSNMPNATVAEVVGGWRIQPSTNRTLPQALRFPGYTGQGFSLLEWDNQPTNLMAQLTIRFAATNQHWFTPELAGQRLCLTFSSGGLAQLSLEDQIVISQQTSGSNTLEVALSINHPHGGWDQANNRLLNWAQNDHSVTNAYQRTDASYALVYAFEVSPTWLRARQNRLDAYRQQGLADTSREVVCETLNVMGLGWMEQTELASALLVGRADMLAQNHHRLGRMAQEQGKGYYIDVYMELSSLFPASGLFAEDILRFRKTFDLTGYFGSALEHALIEQLQSSNLVAASTIKMLQLANTNSLKMFLARSANWTAGANVRSQLTNYNLTKLDNYINLGYDLFLPRDGSNYLAGPGSWKG